MEPHVRRRLEFLLAEASADVPVRDIGIKMVERSVSNFATIGATSGTSKSVKKRNAWMSRGAYERACTIGFYDDWHDGTTNEHEHELIEAWRELCALKGAVSVEQALLMFSSPFVTILIEENARLRAVRTDERSRRYELAGIEVGRVEGLWARGGLLATPVPAFVARTQVPAAVI